MPPKFRVSHLHYILSLRQDELLRERECLPWMPVSQALTEVRLKLLESQLAAGKRWTSPSLVLNYRLTDEGRRLADEFAAIVVLIRGLLKIAHRFED